MHRSRGGLRFTHVRSHTNNIANEFADRVDDLARRSATINGSPDFNPFDIPLGDRSALPSLPVAFDADEDARAISFWNSVECEAVDPKSLKRFVLPVSHATRITCITARRPDPCRLLVSAVEMCLVEFALAGASIVGLHMPRSKEAFARRCDAFFMTASAATKAGTDGCEFWVATSLKPSSSTVRPIISKPSMLVVALELPFAQITVMVAHARVEQQPQSVRETCWTECFESLVTARVDFASLFVLIDATLAWDLSTASLKDTDLSAATTERRHVAVFQVNAAQD